MSEARDIRAKALATMVGGKYAAASVKDRPGSVEMARFGMAKNMGKPEVRMTFVEFDVSGDDVVMARLRSAWGK